MGQHQNKLAPSDLKDLRQQTVFTQDELKQWYEKFIKDYPVGYMTKNEFMKVYQNYYKKGNSHEFSEHVFRVFDLNQDGRIDFREFICSLSLTTRGSIDDKLRWAFSIYDVNGDGKVCITEVTNIVRSIQALVNVRDRNLTDNKILEIFQKFDQNTDGYLTCKEFVNGTKSNPMFMKLLTDYIQ